MWLFRGAQSAVFYYASCTPCGEYFYRRKRKREAARTVRDPSREGIVTDQPVFFHQPFPFTTNSYWSEEIALGPGPPSRKGHRNGTSRTSSQRNLTSPQRPADPEVLTGTLEGLKKDKDALKNPIGDAWNRFRYQREDEELWGLEVKGSSVGLSGRGRSDSFNSSKYYIARNPEVNDLHPPVVCGPRSRAETRWMLQPPPSAKVMAGKVRAETSVRQSRDTSPLKRPSAIPEEPELSPSIKPSHKGRKPLSGRSPPPISLNPSEGSHALQPTTSSHRKTPEQQSGDILCPVLSFGTSTDSLESSISRQQTPRAPLSTIAPSSRLPSNTETSGNVHLTLSPTLISPSNSPGSRALQREPLVASSSALLHKTSTTYAEDRPSTNDTVDSGKAFRFRTPLTPIWAANTHANNLDDNTKRCLGLRLEADADDFDDFRHIQPYRWSMDI
ncbi:hypothetical protein CPC735_033680 [Coccidioides posadasii C735 delta SOWgp]|uniref:Uncharacterized protein n=1 Tax=Coccidioides posadasii (strain C735) TaxID=222929 RepID=C5P5P2_COCP7|nr:hypothetical protein CPC735_033680 [Coccidioides posadasii C735 delta SOWgp]EER28032.1 hypothetical protein CPC735_033680 [Coccidioides posadasii C735 delta SOWgp]|eukprot:XP_003070177.1 hypothetical protein CPC735_033680 [Coccidioides posadasii C735 delta SOWgp]